MHKRDSIKHQSMQNHDSEKQQNNENIDSSQNNQRNKTNGKKRDTLIPLPACCQGPKCDRCWKIFKYVYVIGIIIFGFGILALQQIDAIGDYIDEQQAVILGILIEGYVIWIILVLCFITLLKAFGVKDILGLRTISVVILAYRIYHKHKFITLLITMFIIGLLSSLSKLIEYQVIGHELQVVQGTPFEYIFYYLRKILMFCIKDESKLEWVDPKWTFEISEVSRNDPSMDMMSNLENVITDLIVNSKIECCRNCVKVTTDSKGLEIMTSNSGKAKNIEDEQMEKDKLKHQLKGNLFWKSLYFFIAVIWASTVEWIQPITELYLYAHNWDLSILNALIIIFSEFADFDKAVEAWFLISGLYDGMDIIGAKADSLVSRPVFWTLGYLIIMPPTLGWAYRYHQINRHLFTKNDEQEMSALPDSSNDTQTNETMTNSNPNGVNNGSTGSYTV